MASCVPPETQKMCQILIVYDGDCPLCSGFARLYKIKKSVGTLKIINAREADIEIINQINARGFNLDLGFVVKIDEMFYHGSDASNILALIGSDVGIFNRLNILIFRSKILSKIIYPFFRAVRNFALWIKGKNQINNLLVGKTIFQSIFAQKWNDLPNVMRDHYANRAFCNDVVIAEGIMEIEFSKIFGLFSALFRNLKILIAKRGKNIFTRVTFRSESNSSFLHFEREFFFEKNHPQKFFSAMVQLKENKVAEVMNYGISWIFFYNFNNQKITLSHHGYALKIGEFFLPLPLTFLFGKVYAEEIAISDDEFAMKMTITHFVFSEIYRYQGQFKIIKKI
ncbi:MAG: DUF4166 domain-containing protein [Proteobacteria bacterium]|nr:DUF4166 domain-containing protein [Pseudomonadota bacterium]